MRRFYLVCLIITLSISIIEAKSVSKAMLLSAILPGTGEIYSGNIAKGITFMTADMVILYNANRYGNEVDWLDKSFKQYAYAKADIPKNRSSDYYELLHNWKSSEEYNNYYEMLARNYFLIVNSDPDAYNEFISTHSYTGDTAWRWKSNKDWKQYRQIRKDKQTMIMNQKLAIGAAIVNRLISVIDAAIVTKAVNRKTIQTSVNVSPDFQSNGFVINCSLEF